jgi:hypothetical protein
VKAGEKIQISNEKMQLRTKNAASCEYDTIALAKSK